MPWPKLATRRSRRVAFVVTTAALCWIYAQNRPRQEVVGWSRWDTLTRDGSAAMDAGDVARAEPLLGDALVEARRAGTPQQVAWSLHSLATLRSRQQRYADAEDCLVQAIAIVERERPVDEGYLARLAYDAATACVRQQKSEEALSLMDRCVELSRRALGARDPKTLQRVRERAGLLLFVGRVTDATREIAEADLLTPTSSPATRTTAQ